MSLKGAWKDQIDSELDEKIQRFVDEKSTGTISLNVSQGEILTWGLKDHGRNNGKKVAEKK